MTRSIPPPREEIRLDTRHIGRRVFLYDAVSSTNDLAARLADDPTAEGSVILADEQTAGRGQYGRTWHSGPGTSVLMSVHLRPPAELRRPVLLTAWAAVSVADAVAAITSLRPRIKWPNDLLLSYRKICGILIEQSTAVAVGIGLNVNQSAADFATAGLPDATSLALTDGTKRECLSVAVEVIHRLDERYDRLGTGDVASLESEWRHQIGLTGQPVLVEQADGSSLVGTLRELSFERVVLGTGSSGVRTMRPEQVRRIAPPG
jgi:BirA family biotin operon repressor/biotin-[acetyl-CoA-carboxylase] ligase